MKVLIFVGKRFFGWDLYRIWGISLLKISELCPSYVDDSIRGVKIVVEMHCEEEECTLQLLHSSPCKLLRITCNLSFEGPFALLRF